MKNLDFKNTVCKFDIKGLHDDDDFVNIEGLASTFGNLDRDNDIIAKGAFTNTLTKRMPKLLNQHRTDQPVGVIDVAFEAEEGLRIKARMPKANSMVKDLLPLLTMGALNAFSIGFNIVESDTSADGVRIIKEVDLFEVSIVTFPANEEARILGVKKIDEKTKDRDEKIVDAEMVESINTRKELEQVLKDTGMFTKKARYILASRFNEIITRSESVVKLPKRSESAGEGNTTLLIEAMNQLKKSYIKEA